MRKAACALAALLVLPAAARGQVDRTVTAGPLTATVQADPWKVGFGTLEEGGDGLGFRDATGWHRATKVLVESRDGEAYVAEVATDDPLGRTLAVRIAPDADGVIALTASAPAGATATGMGFASADGERYLGFGERNVAVDHRGLEVENFVSDGPYQPEERPAIAAFVPPQGFRLRDDATYFPIPWLLSSRGFGVLIDRDETSRFELGEADRGSWSLDVDGPQLALRVFAGPRPRDALRRFSARVGRQPRAAAPFFFGPWWQPTGGDQTSLERLRAADATGSLAQTYTHYLPCADHAGSENGQLERTRLFHDAGLAVTTYFNPMLCTEHPRYAEAVAQGVLHKNAAGQPYEYKYTGSTVFFVGQMDFSAPNADAFYASLLGEATAAGYDGWMEDFGEYTPPDAVSADGTPGPAMHNRYVTLYHRSARRFAESHGRPLARFNRSGWTGTAQYAQIVWGGDPTTDWGFDGLTSSVRQALSMGLSGVSLWGSDIGGFFALGSRNLTPELLVRWIEFGFASGVMRVQANGFDLPEKERPQIWDEDVLPVWRRYARLRTQLYPYLAAAQRQYDRSGLPMMRHHALTNPGDAEATARDDQYLLGDDLLVAPVLGPGQTEREVYLPVGRWVDLWRSTTLTDAVAPRLGRAKVLDGGGSATLPAPRDELPLLVRAGAVLPLLAPDVDTLAGYGSDASIVHLKDRPGRRLLAFPRGSTRSWLGPAEKARSVEGPRSWRLAIDGARRRSYALQASLATLRRPFVPCAVRLGGRRLRGWRYDRDTQVLRVRFATRDGVVRVKACN